MDIERRIDHWLVTISRSERADLYADGEHPPDRALAAVADQENIDVDELHTSAIRATDGGIEVVVRRRDQQRRF